MNSIKDNFEAYLPFWYFMGHTAKYIAEDKSNGLNDEARNYFLYNAKRHFEKFDSLNSYNILREDELTASFALEYIDLLLLEENTDNEKITDLINIAIKMAGNANDIIELCAVAYLKIGETTKAEKLLAILVNENFNTAANAKLLSRIYVSEFLKGSNPLAFTKYGILASRVASAWLFPMPDEKSNDIILQDYELQKRYMADQKFFMQKEYLDAITQFIEKYIILFNRIIPFPVENVSDDCFLDTEEAHMQRHQDIYDALKSDRGNEYRNEIRDSGFRFRSVELINEMLNALDGLQFFRENISKEYMILLIRKNITKASKDMKNIQDKLNQDGAFSVADYEKIQSIFSFRSLTKEFFDILQEIFISEIEKIDSLDKMDNAEFDIVQFCNDQNLSERNHNNAKAIAKYEESSENDYIPLDVIGKYEHDESFGKATFDKMLAAIQKVSESIIEDNNQVEMIVRGDLKFELYFKNVKLKGDAFKSKTLAIIDNHSFVDSDLFITCDGVVPVKHSKPSTLRNFDRVEYKGKSLSLGWPEEYSNRYVNIGNLYDLIETLGKIRNNAASGK
ncbi:MAG: hypothetical protein LKJ83_01785 [Eubacteriaceae bacterium]|jgi:hypothetical protein|nr:hypothetical protein [Eubacteriaceae bacterium]